MKIRKILVIFLALALFFTIPGCGEKPANNPLEEVLDLIVPAQKGLSQEDLPENTAALELFDVCKNRNGYVLKCYAYDEDVCLLSEAYYRLPLAENASLSFYPMDRPGSRGEDYYSAESFYDQYDKKQMQGLMFWTYEFDADGALCYLSDEVPRELIVEEHPVEDFYGCWDYSDSFWQPGLEMYNVPGEPPCGDYIVLYEDGTAEVYRLEENTVYLASWEMWGASAYIEELNIFLSFTDIGLEDSNGHYGDPGTAPSTDGMDYVDLT